ncbi:MAG TPA: hypothetical protein VHA78_00400 [Candidatus Peribacteraceae bacterium]|nr:hypothetical protein [Candidatus Peribacteraceae bacterium]
MEAMCLQERLQLPDHVPGPIKRLLDDYAQIMQLIVNSDVTLQDEDDTRAKDIKKLKRSADPEARMQLLKKLDETLTTMETIAHQYDLELDAWVESYRGDIARIINNELNYTRGVFDVFKGSPKVLVRKRQKAQRV